MTRKLHRTPLLQDGIDIELTTIQPCCRGKASWEVFNELRAQRKRAQASLRKRLMLQIDCLLDRGHSDEFTLKWALLLLDAPSGTTVTLSSPREIEVQLGQDAPA